MHGLPLVVLDKLVAKLVGLQFVDLRLADDLVGERVVVESGLGNDVLNLVGRGEEFAERDGLSRIGRAIFLLQPQPITVDFGRCCLGLSADTRNLLIVVTVLLELLQSPFLINAHEGLVHGRIGAHILDVGLLHFLQQKFDAQICIFVLTDSAAHAIALGRRTLHAASHFHMDFINLPHLLPHIADGAERFQHALLHNGVAQGVLLETTEEGINVLGTRPAGRVLSL